MEKSYLKIWTFLEGKLSPKQEEELMDWISKSDRNAVYFDEVVTDFNEIKKYPPAPRKNRSWYWAAASVFLFLLASVWLVNPFSKKDGPYNISLPDGSSVVLNEDSEFEYDSLSFDATKWIKIRGTAEVKTTVDEHLLVETQTGYLIMDGTSSVQIQELENEDIKVLVNSGSIRWLNPFVTSEELSLMGGEKLLFKNDGKTVLLNYDARPSKKYLIFDNYMNL